MVGTAGLVRIPDHPRVRRMTARLSGNHTVWTLVGVLAILAGCQSSASSASTQESTGASTDPSHTFDSATPIPTSTYTSTEWGYQVSYPADWIDEHHDGDVFYPSNAAIGFGISHVHPLPELRSASAFASDSRTQYVNSGATLLHTAPYSVDGEDGQLAVYLTEQDSSEYVTLNVAVYHGGVGYDLWVIGSQADGAEQQLRAWLDGLLARFSFTE